MHLKQSVSEGCPMLRSSFKAAVPDEAALCCPFSVCNIICVLLTCTAGHMVYDLRPWGPLHNAELAEGRLHASKHSPGSDL